MKININKNKYKLPLILLLLSLIFNSCSSDDNDSFSNLKNRVPTVITVSCNKAKKIENNNFYYHAIIKIKDKGDSEIIKKGVCYGTTNECTKKSTGIVNSDGNQYTVLLMGLKGKTKYYVKAFATNDDGTGYGKTISFTTP